MYRSSDVLAAVSHAAWPAGKRRSSSNATTCVKARSAWWCVVIHGSTAVATRGSIACV